MAAFSIVTIYIYQDAHSFERFESFATFVKAAVLKQRHLVLDFLYCRLHTMGVHSSLQSPTWLTLTRCISIRSPGLSAFTYRFEALPLSWFVVHYFIGSFFTFSM